MVGMMVVVVVEGVRHGGMCVGAGVGLRVVVVVVCRCLLSRQLRCASFCVVVGRFASQCIVVHCQGMVVVVVVMLVDVDWAVRRACQL